MRHARGFTLIELMVVIAIIAILAAIAVSAYSTAIVKAQFSEAMTVTDGLKPDISSYYHQVGACPGPGDGGIVNPASYAGKYVATATVASIAGGCSITAVFRTSTVSPDLRGKQVVLKLDNAGGSGNAQWVCSSNVLPKYLPEACR